MHCSQVMRARHPCALVELELFTISTVTESPLSPLFEQLKLPKPLFYVLLFIPLLFSRSFELFLVFFPNFSFVDATKAVAFQHPSQQCCGQRQ